MLTVTRWKLQLRHSHVGESLGYMAAHAAFVTQSQECMGVLTGYYRPHSHIFGQSHELQSLHVLCVVTDRSVIHGSTYKHRSPHDQKVS